MLCATLLAWVLLSIPQQTHADANQRIAHRYTFEAGTINPTGTINDTGYGTPANGYFYGGATTSADAVGIIGQAMTFDGSQSYFQTQTLTDINNASQESISVWYKTTQQQTNKYLVSIPRDNVAGGNGFDINFSGDGVRSVVQTAGVAAGIASSTVTTYADGRWHNVVATYDGNGNHLFYFDGVLGTPDPANPTGNVKTDIGDDTLQIGRFGAWGGYANATIDDVRVYVTALTQQDVSQIYGNGRKLFIPPNNLGLVGYWPMNEATGTIVHDMSGFGNQGTLQTNGSAAVPAWIPGKFGKALSFDGSGNNVAVGGSFLYAPTTTPFSISAWYFLKAFGSNPSALAQLNTDSGTHDAYIVLSNNCPSGYCGITFCGTDGWDTPHINSVPVITGWHHVVVTYNGSGLGTVGNFTMYLDGVAQSVADGGPNNCSTASALSTAFGNDTNNPADNPWNGYLDDIRIYSRVLGASEVAGLFAKNSSAVRANANSANMTMGSNLGPGSGLIGHWTFDGPDVTKNAIIDRSGKGNNAYYSGSDSTSSAKVIGKLGQALHFNGVDDQVLAASNNGFPSGNVPWTITAWVNPEADDLKDDAARQIASFNNSSCGVNIGCNPTLAIEAKKWEASDFHHDVPGSTPVAGQWAFIAGSYDPNTAVETLWINGVWSNVYGGIPVNETGVDNSTMPSIGNEGGPGGREFYGKIDDVPMYSVALGTSSIQQLYHLGTTKVKN